MTTTFATHTIVKVEQYQCSKCGQRKGIRQGQHAMLLALGCEVGVVHKYEMIGVTERTIKVR